MLTFLQLFYFFSKNIFQYLEEDDVDSETLKIYRELEQRDRRRWTVADRWVDILRGQCLEICICTVNDHLIRNKNVQLLSKAEYLNVLYMIRNKNVQLSKAEYLNICVVYDQEQECAAV